MHVEVFSDPETLAAATAESVARWLEDATHTTLGLAGGSTPRLTYEMLRDAEVPWHRVHGWMTDERHVTLDDPDSNAGMAKRALFDHVPATLHPVRYDENPAAAASAYEATLDVLFASETADGTGLILLGMGTDGHTASLFPGTTALSEVDRDYVANWLPETGAWRLTATLSLLSRAARTIFIVSGAAKAPVVARILEDSAELPAGLVSRQAPDPVWMLDEAAARCLS